MTEGGAKPQGRHWADMRCISNQFYLTHCPRGQQHTTVIFITEVLCFKGLGMAWQGPLSQTEAAIRLWPSLQSETVVLGMESFPTLPHRSLAWEPAASLWPYWPKESWLQTSSSPDPYHLILTVQLTTLVSFRENKRVPRVKAMVTSQWPTIGRRQYFCCVLDVRSRQVPGSAYLS